MKKMFLIAVVLCAVSCTGNRKDDNVVYAEILSKVNTMGEATYERELVDSVIAGNHPGTLIFVASGDNIGAVVVNSLPQLHRGFDTILAVLPHGNVTLVDRGDYLVAITTKHLFDSGNKDKDLMIQELLSQKGFEFSKESDFAIALFKKNQTALKCNLLGSINPDSINGSKCEVRALNCFNGGPIYSYKISGRVCYLNNDEKKFIMKNAFGSGGDINTDGLYLVKVPDGVFSEILGMSGSSVVIEKGGEDFLLGIVTNRLYFEVTESETFKDVFMVIQPVTKYNLNLN